MFLMPRSHLHVMQPRNCDLRDMELDVAIAWQLRGLRGNYGIFVAVIQGHVGPFH